jgi:hypothetical protein
MQIKILFTQVIDLNKKLNVVAFDIFTGSNNHGCLLMSKSIIVFRWNGGFEAAQQRYRNQIPTLFTLPKEI